MGKPGRPPLSDEKYLLAHKIVESEWRHQGVGAGEGSIAQALKGLISIYHVRKCLKKLKRQHKRKLARIRKENRLHVEAKARDAMWSVDATELERKPEILQAETIREVCTTKTLAATVGPPACAKDFIRNLENAAEERGCFPYVLISDNGPVYRCKKVRRFLRRHQVIQLLNLPFTPQHNSTAETGIRELKEHAVNENGEVPAGENSWITGIQGALRTLNHRRLRKTRGYRTAAQVDLAMPRASDMVPREVFFKAACSAIWKAEADTLARGATVRERRRAVREAIFATLESFGLIHRWRGDRPTRADESASFL